MSSPTNREQPKPKLPLWVEILFVQIGLPDKWLSKILKKKKATKQFINVNSKTIYYSFVILISLVYIYPAVKYSYQMNRCISKTSEALKNSGNMSILDLDDNVISTAFCNGMMISNN